MNRYAKKVSLKPGAEAFILPWEPPAAEPRAPAPTANGTAVDVGALFGNSNPLEIEVGFGTGLFLTTYAAQHPPVNLLGVEITKKMVWHVANKAMTQGLGNVRLVHGDARAFLKEKIKSGAVHRIHLYFPDPWPKKRHRKRRAVNQPFLETAFRILRPGGTFHFATDHAEYFEYFGEETVAFGRFNPAASDLAPLPTSYELKWTRQGRQIFRAVLQKPGSPA